MSGGKKMSRYEVRKEEIKQRSNALEKKQETAYDEMAELKYEIDDLSEKILKKQEKVIEFKKQGDILGSYLDFLENQLVIEALEQQSYSIENFGMLEKARLIYALRNGEDLLFAWYVNKKKEGYEFNQIAEPLHKVLKEDYEDFCAEQSKT